MSGEHMISGDGQEVRLGAKIYSRDSRGKVFAAVVERMTRWQAAGEFVQARGANGRHHVLCPDGFVLDKALAELVPPQPLEPGD